MLSSGRALTREPTAEDYRRENEYLLEEIAMLKRELGVDKDRDFVTRLQMTWKLTGREAQLLTILFKRKSAVVSKERLLTAMYEGAPDEPEAKIIDVFVCKLRNKMGEDCIRTAWGSGYAITPQGMRKIEGALGLPLSSMPDLPLEQIRAKKPYSANVTLRAMRLFDDGPKTARELATYMGWDGHRAAGQISNLRQKGILQAGDRQRINNRWTVLYALTPAGVKWLEEREHMDA